VSAARTLFKGSAGYLDLINEIMPTASKHEYNFVSEEWFREWLNSEKFNLKHRNFIIALELIEKAHLASITALLRAKRWADGICLAYEHENFLCWGAAFRGLLESAGDTLDALIHVPLNLAEHYQTISRCLSGDEDKARDFSEFEDRLNHFCHAKKMRTKKGEENVLKAKDAVTYINVLEKVVPNVTSLYQQLCSLCHPADASIEYFFDFMPDGKLKLSATKDREAIRSIISEYPNVLQVTLMLHCNAPLLMLRVLQKFPVHPRLERLRKIPWKTSKAGTKIDELLKNQHADKTLGPMIQRTLRDLAAMEFFRRRPILQ
jgi:hypothetical protein